MKNEAVRYLVSLIALLLLALSLTPACSFLKPAPPPTYKPPVTQPPAVSENQSAIETETPTSNQPVDQEKWYPVVTFSGTANETTSVFHIYGAEWHLDWTIDADNLEKAV